MTNHYARASAYCPCPRCNRKRDRLHARFIGRAIVLAGLVAGGGWIGFWYGIPAAQWLVRIVSARP